MIVTDVVPAGIVNRYEPGTVHVTVLFGSGVVPLRHGDSTTWAALAPFTNTAAATATTVAPAAPAAVRTRAQRSIVTIP
ncbi:hypothetical protein [Dactylosporangium sp. NPDC051541]|uniref:hypothetical protein n=1 Tax=Dactylosporangium sp. NPDC051541 TaxID=3363977 RepID=UPI0037973BE5